VDAGGDADHAIIIYAESETQERDLQTDLNERTSYFNKRVQSTRGIKRRAALRPDLC
jgi:hypothetical protein